MSGLLLIDITLDYDHITSAIGNTLMA
ncbi:MAG: phosphomethylpyrimidine synthase ThiC [Candidatus Adiutrix intracellularis]|nr:phosphomethylpyrimidine synthase ThiC [Candidatus Adiutrix intracellularis]